MPDAAERGHYSAGKGPKRLALVVEVILTVLVAAVLLITWRNAPLDSLKRRTSMSVFNLPLPSAPPAPPEEVAPGPKQVRTPEQPKTELDKKPDPPIPIVLLPGSNTVAAAKTSPELVRPPQQRVEQTTAPAATPLPPKQIAAAPALGTPTIADQVAQQTWEGKVLAKLERMKRYPEAALASGQQDLIYVVITVDRSGRVVSRAIRRSRGIGPLDAEVLALIARANPLPKPPASARDRDLTFEVPVEFTAGGTRNRRR